MHLLDDWHDYLRLIIFMVNVACLYLLGRRAAKNRHSWNSKTKDYWFSLVMWSMAGVVIAFEGIVRDAEFGIRSIFVIAASLVTIKGLLARGSWGGSDD